MDVEGMVRKSILFPEILWEEISEWRFDQRIGTEADAIRQLAQMGLHYHKLSQHPDWQRTEANVIEDLNSSLAG